MRHLFCTFGNPFPPGPGTSSVFVFTPFVKSRVVSEALFSLFYALDNQIPFVTSYLYVLMVFLIWQHPFGPLRF